MQKALLNALLEPEKELIELERSFRNGRKLALLEERKMLPLGAVYDYFCLTQGVPVAAEYIKEVEAYEKKVQSRRG